MYRLLSLIALVSLAYAYTAPSPSEGISFLETFSPDWASRWVITADDKFQGKWAVENGIDPQGIDGDQGLVVQNVARHHGIVHPFSTPLDFTDKDLVVQYEVRLQSGLECGGAYLKLLTASDDGPQSIVAETPYTIMFGPDKCGNENKVHFIFRHENPITHEFEEKHLQPRPSIKTDSLSHLYTLYVQANNSFEVFIDQQSVRRGSLLNDFTPAVNPPKQIDDPTDEKPSTWVDEAEIPDPAAVKPEDWDESEPRDIPDPDDSKPDGWLDDAPKEVPDPDAVKPDDWEDDLDGEWEAPLISNPACEAVGCGKWKPRTTRNPKYKGKWVAPNIPNPAYIGVWHPRQIDNPDYFEDLHPHNFKPIGAIGFELWTMTDKIAFDNILIGHSKAAADEFAAQTWKVKFAAQSAADEARQAREREKQAAESPSSGFKWDFASLYKAAQDLLRHYPERVYTAVGAALLIPLLLALFVPRGRPSSTPAPSNDASSGASTPAADNAAHVNDAAPADNTDPTDSAVSAENTDQDPDTEPAAAEEKPTEQQSTPRRSTRTKAPKKVDN